MTMYLYCNKIGGSLQNVYNNLMLVSLSLSSAPSVSGAGGVTAAGPQRQMTYQQLEDNINKWMTDLEKQEKDFLEQATQVNAWDRVLIENGEKVRYV